MKAIEISKTTGKTWQPGTPVKLTKVREAGVPPWGDDSWIYSFVCECSVYSRGLLCQHVADAQNQTRMRRIIEECDNKFALWIFSSPKLIVPFTFMEGGESGEFYVPTIELGVTPGAQTWGSGSLHDLDGVGEASFLSEVRSNFLEWLVVQVDTHHNLMCKSKYHMHNHSPYEDPEDFCDQDGDYTTVLLEDVYNVLHEGMCSKCKIKSIAPDYDDQTLVIG